MKTFETEKGNIPEGATHIITEGTSKSWVKIEKIVQVYDESIGNWVIIIGDRESEIESNAFSLDSLQESHSEWNGEGLPHVGVECLISVMGVEKNKGVIKYMGNELCIFETAGRKEISCYIKWLAFHKIESPEEKEQRERLEAAYDLYCLYAKMVDWPIVSIDEFKEDHPDKDAMLAIVDKTNYRKGE